MYVILGVACQTVVRKAFELGVRIVLIDSPDSWSKKLVDEKKAVKFIGAAWLESGVEVRSNLEMRKRRRFNALETLSIICSNGIWWCFFIVERMLLHILGASASDHALTGIRFCLQLSRIPKAVQNKRSILVGVH